MDTRNGKRGKFQTVLMAGAIIGVTSASVFVMPAPSWAAKINGVQCYSAVTKSPDGSLSCRGAKGMIYGAPGSTCTEDADGGTQCPRKKTTKNPPPTKGTRPMPGQDMNPK